MEKRGNKDWFWGAEFVIWLVVVCVGPMVLCDSTAWIICGFFGGQLGLLVAGSQDEGKTESIAKYHLYALLGYCFTSTMLIGLSNDITYESIKDLGKCAILYSAATIIMWIAESIYKQRKESQEREEELERLKRTTKIEIGRFFVRIKWSEYEQKPQLKHLIKPIFENEDVWEIISISCEEVTLQSCINDRAYINKGNGWHREPKMKLVCTNEFICAYTDISDIFDSYKGKNDLLESYKSCIGKLKKREAIIKQWVENKKDKH